MFMKRLWKVFKTSQSQDAVTCTVKPFKTKKRIQFQNKPIQFNANA
jgi:hypothetical protein